MEQKSRKVEVRSEHLAITAKGVVVQGEVATEVATLLVQRNPQMLTAIRELDREFDVRDIEVDRKGRVIFRSSALQRLAFEAVRSDSKPGSARRLGKLVALTGGRMGSRTSAVGSADKGADAGESKERGESKPPPVKGQSPGSHIDYFCPGDGGINIVCVHYEPGDPDWEHNACCGMGY